MKVKQISSTFISKTKSALAYYENNISKNGSIDALYYLADDVVSTYDNHEGGSAQQNAAHLIEFLGATAIVDFSKSKFDTPGKYGTWDKKRHLELYHLIHSIVRCMKCFTTRWSIYDDS